MERSRANHACTKRFYSLKKVMMNSTNKCLDKTVACLHRVCCPSLPDSGKQEDSRMFSG